LESINVPFSPRLGWIGVDVGTHTVKLAQAARVAGRLRLERAAVIQRASAWSASDDLAWDQPLASESEIHAALAAGGFSGRDAVCALPMNVCQLRGMIVPPGTDHERRTMIADELTDEWAERGSAMEFDYWELDAGAAEKNTDRFNVNVLAVGRPWVSQLAADCRRAGLNVWAVDGVPPVMARAVGLADGPGGGRRVLAIDWGYSNATLCVIGDARPIYARRVHHCGYGKVLDGIASELAVTLDEAQHLAGTQGLALTARDADADLPAQRAITEAARATLEELLRETRRTLQFVEMQRRHLQPASVWLLGGGATLRNIAPYLEETLELPVRVWSAPTDAERLPFAAGECAALFAGAVALSALAWRAA
jgi:Tfp pilus assembly PilM family ATPase